MKEPIRTRDVDFTDPSRTKIFARGHEGEIEFFGEGKFPGVRFKDWKFKDVDLSDKDGALIEIDPGARTPVQIVEADKVFSDVPLKGKLTFLHLDTEGNLNIYRFDSSREEGKSIMFEIGKGEIMCWFASPEQDEPAELMEYEEPGFTLSDLTNIEPGTTEVSGRFIPANFWEIVGALEAGKFEDITIPIVELDTLE